MAESGGNTWYEVLSLGHVVSAPGWGGCAGGDPVGAIWRVA